MPDNRDYQRPKTNPALLAVPSEVTDQVTGVLQGEELRTERANRPTPIRFEHIEGRLDEQGAEIKALRGEMKETREVVAGLRGELAVMPSLVDTLKSALASANERATFKVKGEVEVGTAQELDKLDARKARRERWSKIIGGGVGGAGILELLHRLFG